MNEYDFQPQDVDENPCINQLPQSLQNSRVFRNNFESIVDQLDQTENTCINILQPHARLINDEKECLKPHSSKGNIMETPGNGNFMRFLQKQKAYEKRAQQKIMKLKQNIDSKIVPQTFHPEINKKSKAYIKNNNENVFQRLTKNNHKKQPQTNVTLFHPQISQKSKNLIRKESIEQILYRDAKLRKQRYESLKENQSEKQKIQINAKNQKLAARKLLKEFSHQIEQMQSSLSADSIISQQLFIDVLSSMGFVNQTTLKYQQGLISSAYAQFCRSSPNYINLFAFLLVLMGVYHVDPLQYFNRKMAFTKPAFMENENQARSIHNKFSVLYNNRLSAEEKANEGPQSRFPFKPAISPKSEVLAEKHRKHFLAQASKLMLNRSGNQSDLSSFQNSEGPLKCHTITHPEFLILNQKMKQIDLSMKRQAEINKRMEQCTFQPNLSKFLVTNRQKSMYNQCEDLEDSENANNGCHPMIILDIDFNGKEEQVVLRLEDQHILPKIAQYYTNKYFMDEESEAKLLSLLQSELLSLK